MVSRVHYRKKIACLCVVFAMVATSILAGGTVSAATTVTVNPGLQYQTTEGWGTSLCWWGNVIGGYSDTNRNAVADLIFSPSAGLGLNIVRYNIGGGENPGHEHMGAGKEMPGYKPTEAGAYDWTQDANQRWMLSAAKARIASGEFIAEAFSNSPPYWMTNSGCASGAATGSSDNLKSTYYAAFADYLTEVVKHFKDSWGVTFRTLEPLNEPLGSWGANGGQEGCHVSNSAQASILTEVQSKLNAKGLTGTKISAPDGYSYDQTVNSYNSYSSAVKGYIAQINTHGYSGGSSRPAVYNLASSGGKRLWASEIDGSGAANPFDVWTHNHNDVVPALDLANRVILDMKDLKPHGWVLWQAVESEQAQISLNKNWGLIHADYNGGQNYYMTKKYYGYKQFTKFIRPGYKQIDVDNANAIAFMSQTDGKLVIVVRNATSGNVAYDYNLSGFSAVGATAAAYRTSASENFATLSNINISNKVLSATANANSITTYVISGITYSGGTTTAVNDNTTSTSNNQFEYSGTWSYGSQSGAYNSDNHWSSTTNGYYQVRFNGSQVKVYAAKAPGHGIVAVSIDGGAETNVDLYASSRQDQALVYTSPGLALGQHTLKVRTTGTKNGSSTGYTNVADRVDILN